MEEEGERDVATVMPMGEEDMETAEDAVAEGDVTCAYKFHSTNPAAPV